MPLDHHVVSALLTDRPGAVDRAIALVRKLRLRLESLTVGRTEDREHVRLTLVIRGQDQDADRLRLLLDKQVDVRATSTLGGRPYVRRDLALVKVDAGTEARTAIHQLCQMFRAHVVDVGPSSLIVEIAGDDAKIEGLLALLRPYGVAELARSGTVALGRAEHTLTPPTNDP